MSKLFSVGASWKHGKSQSAAELFYDATKDSKNKGLNGMPLFLRAGTLFTCENKIKYHRFYNLGQQWWITEKVEVPIDSNTKVTVNSKYDLLKAAKFDKTGFQAGLAVEIKL